MVDGKATITNCSNYGNITSENSCAWGMVDTATTINKCINLGNVTAKTYASGIGRSTND